MIENTALNEKIEEFVQAMVKEGFYRHKPPKGALEMFDGETRWTYSDYVKTRQFITSYKKDGSPKYLDLNIIDINREDFPLVTKTIYDINRPFGKVEGEAAINTAKLLTVKFPIEAVDNSQDTSILWNHLEYLCGDVPDDVKDWVKDWLADIFQNPNDKKGTALTFIGSQGCGKSIFFDKLMSILLGEYYHYDNGKEFSEKFNTSLKDKLLLNFDEGFATKSKSVEAKLKSFITQPTLKLEGKGSNSTAVLNPARAVFTTNSGWAINTADDDRRFAVFNTERKDFITPEYFDMLFESLNNREMLEKFMYELQSRKITSRLNIPPATEAKEAQKVFSATKIAEWFEFIITTDIYYVIKMDDNRNHIHSPINRLWDSVTANERVMHKENAFQSFDKFKGNNEHITTTNKLFGALKNHLSTHKEWNIYNETRRLQGFGFSTIVLKGGKEPARVWVLRRKASQQL